MSQLRLTKALRHPATWIAFAVLVGAIVLFIKLSHSHPECKDVYARDPSPDGRFEVIVCRLPGGAAMPGQGGDAPGLARLVRVRTDEVLEEKELSIIGSYSHPMWNSDSVEIVGVARWDLPP